MATWSLMNADIEWGTNGPSSGYVLKAYTAGTTSTIPIAITETGGSQQATLTTNAEGKFEVSGNEVLPYIDRTHKWALYLNASDALADSNPFAGFYDNVPIFKKDDDKLFAGNDPDLTDTDAAIVIGSDTPDSVQHIEIGPTLMQSKSNQTTAATLNINTLGGTVNAGKSIDTNYILTSGVFQVRNGATVSFETGGGTSKVFNYKTSNFEEILTTGNEFTTLTTSGLTAKEIQSSDVGRETKMTATASVVINISFNGGWEVDEEAVFYYPSLTGTGTMTFTTSANVILLDNRSVPAGYKCSIKYEGNDGSNDIYNFTGP